MVNATKKNWDGGKLRWRVLLGEMGCGSVVGCIRSKHGIEQTSHLSFRNNTNREGDTAYLILKQINMLDKVN